MFTKSAKFYDTLYHFKDYEEASRQLIQWIQGRSPAAKTLLDVACGTGKHLSYLIPYYNAEGLDTSIELLEVARERCPGIPFHQADMADFKISNSFDVITCLFSSIAYVKTIDRLEKTLLCMASHLNPGGTLIIEPWINPENFWPRKIVVNLADEPEYKIAWMYSHEQEDHISVFNIHYLVGTPDGVTHFTERHEMGMFTDDAYRSVFEKAGFKDIAWDEKGLFGRGMYILSK